MFVPRIPTPFDDDARHQERIAQMEDSPRRSIGLCVVGCVLLAAFGIFASMGWPGTGLILVPIACVMILAGAIPLVIDRLAS